MGEAVDLGVQLGRDRLDAKPLESIDQRVRETVQAVSMLHDALALDVVEHFAYLLGREFVMIQERNEEGDGALEVDVVFPECVVGVDEEGLGRQAFSSWLLAVSLNLVTGDRSGTTS